MTLTKTKKRKSKHAKKGKKLTPENKFQREWQRVQNLQKSNQKLREPVSNFFTRVEQDISVDEKAYCEALSQQTERLIRFIPKKTLPDYQREELLFWIEKNLDTLCDNPFNDEIDIDSIVNDFYLHLDLYRDVELEKLKKKYPSVDPSLSPDNKGDHAGAEVGDKEDIYAEFADMLCEEDDLDSEDVFQKFYEDLFGEGEAQEKREKEHSQEMDKLLKSTSINILFRRLAKALHPDLIQDETEKLARHHLMSELINARKNKDIVKIMAMYAEHVGEAPQDIFDGDYEQMTQLLKNQVEQLERERIDIIDENPRHAVIYHCFFVLSETKIKRKLQQHRKTLKTNTRDIKDVTARLSSLKNLKLFLRDLNDQAMMVDFGDFDFDDTSDIPF